MNRESRPASRQERSASLVRQARTALSSGDLDTAERLARQAATLGVRQSDYRGDDDRPGFVLLDVQTARTQASLFNRGSGNERYRENRYGSVQQGAYRSDRDGSYNRTVQATEPTPAGRGPIGPSAGERLFDQGTQALRDGDSTLARRRFKEALAYRDELTPRMRQRLQENLGLLSVRPAHVRAGDKPLETIAPRQRALAEQINADVARSQIDAHRAQQHAPHESLRILEDAHAMVKRSEVDRATKSQLLRRLEDSIAKAQGYLETNRFNLELDERNEGIRENVRRREDHRIEVDEKLAKLVSEFDKLMKERRFAEAELLAKRAEVLDPRNPVAQLLKFKAGVVREFVTGKDRRFNAATGFAKVMGSVGEAAIPFDGDYAFPDPDVEDWGALTNRRQKYGPDGRRRRSAEALEIEQKLNTPVMPRYNDAPLSDVIRELCDQAGINVFIDPQGLEGLGLHSNTAVTIDFTNEVKLKSALNTILYQLNLSYVIKDEALRITSADLAAGEVIIETYPVADLVIPIPNFVPTARMGLGGALHEAHARLGYNSAGAFGGPSVMATASLDGTASNSMLDPSIMAQGGLSGGGGSGDPGGMGGGPDADFDSIIGLITSTVSPQSWDEVGGPGSVQGFNNNLTLVVSQTQDVHENIVDLLQQLRRLQDLQVTIEVRFITLADNFFERIGIDFDFDIDDNVGVTAFDNAQDRQTIDLNGDGIADIPASSGPGAGDSGNSVAVGLQFNPDRTTNGLPLYTTDLDLQFRQGSFGATAPTIGGFDATSAASFGFAILSDIEAFFFIQAAQGDTRTNVMQAPKVTLFNGQQAFISDTAQRPFVTSVIPVVGDFAAAHQPVIVVLSEGTSLTIQAVVSDDRRFVRLTVLPFFSKVGDVSTFTFDGQTTTTTTGSSSSTDADTDDDADNTTAANSTTTTTSGTTVQLPTFEFVTVSTTVSVPDGGTVLLGGIKRLTEERREQGVPMLSKIPYISRLFKNVGIGRETESLMMMVTPRIIIQEEEEARMGLGSDQ